MRNICVFIALCLALTGAKAADIDVRQLGNGSTLVVIDGDLSIGDIETFRMKVASLPAGRASVAFQSRGGRLLAGIRIGTQIRARKFTTVVPDGAQYI